MTETDNPEAAANVNTGATPKLQLQKIYIKDSSFESPNSPQVFTQEWKPTVSLNLNSSSNKVGDNTHEVVMTVSVEAKMGDTLAFLIELQQAGIFSIEDCDDVEDLRKVVGKRCPAMLYPYVREAISDLAGKGGFPQLLLQPFDFDELYGKAEQSPPPPKD